MDRIDTQTPHGHTTVLPKDQFLMLMYDLAEEMCHMDKEDRDPEWHVDEAEEMLIRNGILKGE